MYDTTLVDYPRLPGDESDSERIQRAIDDTPNGIVQIPRGEYDIKKPLRILNRCSLEMHPAAHLAASEKMDYVLTYDGHADYHPVSIFNEDGSIYDNLGLFIRGGDLDGQGLAGCLRITNAHHFTLSDTALHNGYPYGLCVRGDDQSHIYELIANNIYCKCTMKGLHGNIGVYSTCCDCHYTDVIVVDYTIGMRFTGFSNRLTRCHIWGGTVPPESMTFREWSDFFGESKRRMLAEGLAAVEPDIFAKGLPEMLADSVSFDIQGANNFLDGCYADTAVIGYRMQGNNVLTNSGFYNNPLMGLRGSVAVSQRNGKLLMSNCIFADNGTGKDYFYDGAEADIVMRDNEISPAIQFHYENK